MLRWFLRTTLVLIFLLPSPACAKIILLKDGTRVEAENVQEEDGLVRFSLPGYEGIFITYSSEIVEGIYEEGQLPPEHRTGAPTEGAGAEQSPGDAGTRQAGEPTPAPAPDRAPAVDRSSQSPPDQSPKPEPKSEVASTRQPPPAVAEGTYSEYSGIEFYNPRRRFKY